MPTVPTQITRAQVPAYQYITPAIPDQIARGRHSRLIYNNLVLNDLLRPDRYYITEIDGLYGPDIRDNRQPVPGDDGEIPFDAYYGGNTMTITGYIDAGNLAQATKMATDLAAAFGTLVESPMKLNWWDVRDEFSDPQKSQAYWEILSGSATFPGDGTMRFGSTATQAVHSLRQYVDHAVTMRFSIPIITGNAQIGVMAKCTSNTSYLLLSMTKTDIELKATGLSSFQATTWAPAPGVSYWLQLLVVDDVATGYLYNQDPFLTTAAAIATIGPLVLSSGIADQLGYQQSGFAGLYLQGTSQLSSFVVEDFRVDALWPSDFVQNVRPISPPAIKSAISTSHNRFRQDFQLTVRASNPRWTSPLAQTASSIVSGTPTQLLDVVNRGNYTALPVITIGSTGGSSANPRLLNTSNGTYLTLATTIADGNYVVIDCAAHTLTDQSGNNVFSYFDPTSSFIKLRPGVNRLQLLPNPTNIPNCWMTVSWANTWK